MDVKLYSKAQVDALRLPKPSRDMASTLRVYGNPGTGQRASSSWFSDRMVRVPLPYTMKLAWDTKSSVNSILIHDYAVDIIHILKDIQLNARVIVKANLTALGKPLPTTPEIDKLVEEYLTKEGLNLFGGSYNHRLKRGGRTLSAHAFGCAIDLDPARNGMGVTKYRMPEWVIKIFEGYGWTAGARWSGRKCDAMHFQRGVF